ncbi:ABC transporter permease [Nesterenkonia populi]
MSQTVQQSPDAGTANSTASSLAAEQMATGKAKPARSGGLNGPVKVVVGAIVPLALLAVWWLVTDALEIFTPVQLPSPLAVFEAGQGLLESGALFSHVSISVQRVLVGFALGAGAGLVLGSLLGLSKAADALLHPTVGAFRAVPSLAWVPLILLWVGIGEDGKYLLIAIGAFFPVFTSVHSALRHVDPQLVEAGRAFGFHGVRLLTTVQLPAVVPPVFSGLRLGLAQSWLFLVAAELLAAAEGLGFLLTESQNNGRVDRLLLAIVLLAILGKITDALLGLVERKALNTWA